MSSVVHLHTNVRLWSREVSYIPDCEFLPIYSLPLSLCGVDPSHRSCDSVSSSRARCVPCVCVFFGSGRRDPVSDAARNESRAGSSITGPGGPAGPRGARVRAAGSLPVQLVIARAGRLLGTNLTQTWPQPT